MGLRNRSRWALTHRSTLVTWLDWELLAQFSGHWFCSPRRCFIRATLDPGHAPAAFAEYATDTIWVWSHVGQFVGVAALGAALALGAPGCGGSDQGDERERSSGPEPAASPQQFSQRYERLTGVALDASPDGLVGTRLDAAAEPNRFARLGTYSLVWTRDRGDRKEALRGARDPGARGIRWRPSGGAWSAVKTFVPHLVLDWSAGPKRRTTPQFNRLERAVRAAYRGRLGMLEPAERPCERANLPGVRPHQRHRPR